MQNQFGSLVRRVLVYVAGLFFLAFGVAFSVNSNLGVSPVNSLPYVVSVICGVEMGACVVAVFSFYIFLQFVLLRKDFQWNQVAQLVFSTIFGSFVDLAKWIMGDFAIPTYFGKLVMLAISIVLVAIGVCLYMGVNLMNMPMEGLTAAVKAKIFPKKPFPEVKVMMDCLVVGIGIVLSFVFLGRLDGIREGTVLCAILVGKIMKPLQKVIHPMLREFCKMK